MSEHALTVPDSRAPSVSLLRPLGSIKDILEYQKGVRAMVKEALTAGVDYAVIPGTQKRPRRDESGEIMLDDKKRPIYDLVKSLMQPGAQKISNGYGLYPKYNLIVQEVDHHVRIEYVKRSKRYNNATSQDKTFEWIESAGVSIGLYRYVCECLLIDVATGQVRGSHVAACSTLEAKYIDRPRECENTVIQIGDKRAFVGAVRTTFGLSEEFTQDLEDGDDEEVVEAHQSRAENREMNAKEPNRPRPIGSMEEAGMMIFPGKKSAKNAYGGALLMNVPPAVLDLGIQVMLANNTITSDDLSAGDQTLLIAMQMVAQFKREQKRILEAELLAKAEASRVAQQANAPVEEIPVKVDPNSANINNDLPDASPDADDDLPF